jgi:hypothetical protein
MGASIGASLGGKLGPFGAGLGAGFGGATGYLAGSLVPDKPKLLPDGGTDRREDARERHAVNIPVEEE